jgi:hypothetical protein
MFKTLVLCGLLVSQAAQASGVLSVTPVYDVDRELTDYTIALDVQEKLFTGVSYVGSLGVTHYPKISDDADYWRSESGLLLTLGYFNLEAGAAYEYTPDYKADPGHFEAYGRLSLRVW